MDFWRYRDSFCRCHIGDILSVHQSRWSKTQSFRRVAFLNVALFAVVSVMSESREEAGKPPPLPSSQKLEKSLKELHEATEGAKWSIWLHFGLHVVEAKLPTRKSNVGTVEPLWITLHVAITNLRRKGTKTWRLIRQRIHTTKQASLAGRCWHYDSGYAAKEALKAIISSIAIISWKKSAIISSLKILAIYSPSKNRVVILVTTYIVCRECHCHFQSTLLQI